jgi:hypothetical protein
MEAQQPDDHDLAKTTICWIIYAKRQLKPAELQHALAVHNWNKDAGDEQEGEVREKKEIQNLQDYLLPVNDILSVCAGLLTVDKERNIIRFVHLTAQVYFEEKSKEWLPQAQ